MTTRTNRIEEIFQDARAAGRRAGDAGPGPDPQCRREILGSDEARHRRPHPGADRGGTGTNTRDRGWAAHPGSLDPRIRSAHLRRRYYVRQAELHGQCFYNGLCDPLEDTDRLVRRTSAYIDDAQRLAEGDAP